MSTFWRENSNVVEITNENLTFENNLPLQHLGNGTSICKGTIQVVILRLRILGFFPFYREVWIQKHFLHRR